MKILFLSRWFPYPPNNGSKIRIFNVLKQLAARHDVALLSFRDHADAADEGALLTLNEYCSDVRVIPFRDYRPAGVRTMLGLLAAQPRYLGAVHSAEMDAAVANACKSHTYDLIIASQLTMMPYAQTPRDVPALLEEVELAGLRDTLTRSTSPAQRLRPFLTWLKLGAYLRKVLPRFVACTVASAPERANLQLMVPDYANISIIPNAVDLPYYDGDFGPACPNTVIFPGALTYRANFDAVRYFLAEIYPIVRRSVPDVQFLVTGNTDGVPLASLPSHPGVKFTGFLPDVRPAVARSWVSVAPLRTGGGTRLKILESMALGTPVVSTPKGAEGLSVRNGHDILLADSPEQFATNILDLLRSAALRDWLAGNGRSRVESTYSWSVVGRELSALMDQVTASRVA